MSEDKKPTRPKRGGPSLIAAARASTSPTATTSKLPSEQPPKPTRKRPTRVVESSPEPEAELEAQPESKKATQEDIEMEGSSQLKATKAGPGATAMARGDTISSGDISGRSTPVMVSPSKTPAAESSGSARAPVRPAMGTGLQSSGSTSSVTMTAPPGGVQKLKFKPRIPVRRTVKNEIEVKTEQSAAPSVSVRTELPPRGRGRGGPGGPMRGRGSFRGRGNAPIPSQSIAAGVFGGPRNVGSSWNRGGTGSSAARYTEDPDIDQYSDNEDPLAEKPSVIDIGLVSTLSESAPTSLYRDRRLTEARAKLKAEKKAAKKDEQVESARIAIATATVRGDQGNENMGEGSGTGGGGLGVKPEPISPQARNNLLPPVDRLDDTLLDDDKSQDRNTRGQRITTVEDNDGDEDIEVNEAQKVDLSESESEEEEEDMEGDFHAVPGFADPSEKLYTFKFPHLFPTFTSKAPIDLTKDLPDSKDGVKDIKPALTPAAAAAAALRKKRGPPPEGRIGTLVVMKSGKVKMVLGDDIVMNVTPGVPSTFVQNLTHLDLAHKNTNVLGEINKSFVVTPDIDRLLEELYINGGQTPAEKAEERRKRMGGSGVKLEGGLVKMEVD